MAEVGAGAGARGARAPDPGPAATLATLRVALLALLVAGSIGTLIELLLLEHTEDTLQWVPLSLLALAAAVVVWHVASRSAASTRALRGVMLLFVASGVVGIALHLRGNVEFELESSPELRGAALVREAMMGATPVLAPGTMVLLGLLGLLYTYRHPFVRAQRSAGAVR